MRKKWNVLLFVVLAIVAISSVKAMAEEDLEAKVKRMEKRIASQDRKIEELSDQTAQNAQERENQIRAIIKDMNASPSTLPKWMKNLTFFGDLRLRYQLSNYSKGNLPTRNRGRFRVRFGFKKTWLDKQLEAGFRLATGANDDPSDPNQTFTGNFSEKKIWIDLAYAKYTPKALKGFTIAGGKMRTPFFHTDLIFCDDVNPEGVFAIYKYPGLGDIVPFVSFGFFVTDYNSSGGDATLHAYQIGATWKIAKDLKWTSALAYYDWGNYEHTYSRAYNNTESGGRLTSGEFDVLNVTNKVDWVAFNLPMSAYVDYAYNCGNEIPTESSALAIGFKVGQNKKKGDWSARYKYAYIEANATPAAFNDPDFGTTNRKGHVLGGKYNLLDDVTAGVDVFYTQPVSGSDVGETEFTVLADLIWNF